MSEVIALLGKIVDLLGCFIIYAMGVIMVLIALLGGSISIQINGLSQFIDWAAKWFK